MKFLKKHFTIIIIISLSLLVIGLTIYAFWKNNYLNTSYFLGTDKLGHFGDFIGGFLGTLLTLIATIYIYQTFNSQKKSIEIQEEQLTNQKEELKSQKQELILQRQLIAQQQFESTFFNMLNVHRELKNNLEINVISRICNIIFNRESKKPSMKGPFLSPTTISEIDDFDGVNVFKLIRLDFEILYNSFKNLNTIEGSQIFSNKIIKDIIQQELLNNEEILNGNEIEVIKKIFWIIFHNYRNILSHYFRNVYHILKFIRENEIQNNVNYQKYADIFQSQLNEDEQFLLFYNFIVFEDKSKKHLSTKELCDNYNFLENLGHENLLDRELHNNKNFYSFEIK